MAAQDEKIRNEIKTRVAKQKESLRIAHQEFPKAMESIDKAIRSVLATGKGRRVTFKVGGEAKDFYLKFMLIQALMQNGFLVNTRYWDDDEDYDDSENATQLIISW